MQKKGPDLACCPLADMLQVLVWLTPGATVDEAGARVRQPSYLNFDIALEGPPPANHMEVSCDTPHAPIAAKQCMCPTCMLSRVSRLAESCSKGRERTCMQASTWHH